MTQPASLPFGTCLATLPNAAGSIDLTPDMQLASGRNVLSQSLVRRQTTPRGSVITSPNDCVDLRQLLSSGQSAASLQQLSAQLRQELLKDPRVLSCVVTITYNPVSNVTTIVEQLQSSLGPFALTIQLTAGTITQIIAGQ